MRRAKAKPGIRVHISIEISIGSTWAGTVPARIQRFWLRRPPPRSRYFLHVWLADPVAEFRAGDLTAAGDADLRQRLGTAARAKVLSGYTEAHVEAGIEQAYRAMTEGG